jgi:hypothetical protein
MTWNTIGYVDELYDGHDGIVCLNSSCDFAAGVQVPVSAGTTYGDVNLSLARGGAISGTVTSESATPLPGVRVGVRIGPGGPALAWAMTSSSGHYRLNGLPTGNYYVLTQNTPGYVDELYDNVTCPGNTCPYATGTAVAVTAGTERTGVNFALSPGGTITGSVRAAGGSPVGNAQVRFHDLAGQSVGGTSTNPLGLYASPGLPAGTYYVATQNGQGYVDQLWQGIVCPGGGCDLATAGGTPVTVSVATPATGIDFVLMRGGSIAGVVTAGDTGLPLAGVQMRAAQPNGQHVAWSSTNASGSYVLSGLPTGDYYVVTDGAPGFYVDQLYDGVPCPRSSCGPYSGKGAVVSVAADQTTPGIDLTLSRGGTISGTVTVEGTGSPLAGVQLGFFDSSGTHVTWTQTNVSGAYTSPRLPPGTYYARTDLLAGYVQELYSEMPCLGCSITSGTPITVTLGADTANVSFTLTSGAGAFSGTITDAITHQPVANAWVDAVTPSNTYIGSAHADATGAYSFVGLPAGTYYARTNNSAGYVNEGWREISCPPCWSMETLTPITVAASTTTTGIDFTLQKGGTIAGRLTEAGNGTPLSLTVWIVDETGTIVSWMSSDGNGDYSASLAPGPYRVVAGWNAPEHIAEVYDNIQFTNWPWGLTGTPVIVAADLTSRVDFQLERAGRIEGTVTDADTDAPIPGQNVCIWHGWAFTCGTSGTDGRYAITGLPPGAYPVYANGGSAGYGLLYYDGASGQPSYGNLVPPGAVKVTVTAGTATGSIDFALHAGARILGAVTEEGTATPLPNVTLNVVSEFGQQVMSTKTDANGHYALGGLGAGTYYLRTDNADGYANECYGGEACPVVQAADFSETLGSLDFIGGTPIVLAAQGTASNVDFALAKGGRISGRVTNERGSGIGNPGITVFDAAHRKVAGATTDNDGNYVSAQGLPAGDYYVLAGSGMYVPEVYDDLTCLGCSPSDGTPVTVTTGATTPNVDFVLTRGGQIAGRVVDQATGKGFPVNVEVWNDSGVRINRDNEPGGDFTGAYVTGGLPAGTYWVKTRNWSGYVDEAYANVVCTQSCDPHGLPGATPVEVAAGAVTWGIDISLARGALVTGTVTNAAGEPMGGMQGQVYDAGGKLVTDWGTDPSGRYVSFRSLPPGTYHARTRNLTGYLDEVYSHHACVGECDLAGGTDVVVVGSAEAGGVDFVLRPAVSVADATIAENEGTAAFNVTLSHALPAPASVEYATGDGTATAGADYTASSGTLTFAPGEVIRTISVPILNDTQYEADETFRLTLSPPTAAVIVEGAAVGTIVNDDPALPTIAISDASIAEGNSSTRTLSFVVSLSRASTQTVTVRYATADGTASSANDYVAASGTITFAPGQTTRTLTVRVRGERVYEDDETFLVSLSNPTNASLADPTGVGTILNDDALPKLAIGNASVQEGNSGTRTMTFTVTLSAASGTTATASYSSVAGTATPGTDFVPATGIVSFGPGQTSRTITVYAIGDTLREPNETFTMQLTNPAGATIADGVGTGTIRNDDR